MTIPISKIINVHIELPKTVKAKLLCDYSYVPRFHNFGGRNCWVTVVGYDNNQWTDFDLVCTLAKPTKRQLRKLKKAYK